MEQPRFPAWTRRRFLTRAGGLAASATLLQPLSVLNRDTCSVGASGGTAFSESLHLRQAPPAALIDGVAAVCRRLAPTGWRNLFLAVSHAELDIAADLAAILAEPLSR